MADREQWRQYILRGNANRLGRIMRSLFNDMSRTLPYLLAVVDVSVARPDLPGHVERVKEIRNRVRALPLRQLESVLDAIMAHNERGSCYALILGAYHDEKEEAVNTLRRLTDLADAQLSTMRKNIQPSSAPLAILTLMEAGAKGSTSAWTNFLQWSHQTRDTSILGEALGMLALGKVVYRIVPYGLWGEGNKAFNLEGDTVLFSFPVPDALVNWAKDVMDRFFNRLAERDKSISLLAEAMRANPRPWCSAYEDMWLEMMLEPKWGLRDAGVDCATILIHELQAAGHQDMRFHPLDPFPAFRVTFRMSRINGSDRYIEIDLEPSDLLQVRHGALQDDDSILFWVDRILAFTALRAVWTIVMGRLSSKVMGSGDSRTPGSATVRPRFRRLPNGYRASPEARTRALETFRKEPIRGFTFVRQYERGAFPQSGNPLFALSDLGM